MILIMASENVIVFQGVDGALVVLARHGDNEEDPEYYSCTSKRPGAEPYETLDHLHSDVCLLLTEAIRWISGEDDDDGE